MIYLEDNIFFKIKTIFNPSLKLPKNKSCMRILLLFLTFSLLWSCKNDATPKMTETKKEPIVETKEPEETVLTNNYCFVATTGTDINSKDTTSVKLTVIGKEVTGFYHWIPAGKDSARGTLTGTIDNKIITAIYDYVIEGSHQKEEMVLKLAINQLLIKRGELTEMDGMLKLKNPEEAKFSEAIPRVICR